MFPCEICEIFKHIYFEEHLWTTACTFQPTTTSVFSQGVEQNFTKQSFLVNKRKRLNTISETKPNTGQLTINYFLLSLQQQSQDLFARLQGLDCLSLLSFNLPTFMMSWLCCLSRFSLWLFSSCKSSDLNSRSCSSFSGRKPTTSELHLLHCIYSKCHFHLSRSFPLLFSHFLSSLFFVFNIRLSFLIICFGSTFTFLKSLYKVFEKLVIFRELSTC